MAITAKPKFAEGDNLLVVGGKADGMSGKVVGIEKTFQEVRPDGSFDKNGILTIEKTISSIAVPYEFDGETLTVHSPETDFGGWVQKASARVSKFYEYGYTIDAGDYHIFILERSAKKINGSSLIAPR